MVTMQDIRWETAELEDGSATRWRAAEGGCAGGAVWWKERCHAHAEDARERVTERGTLDGPAAVETGRHEHTIAITSERRF